MDNRDRKMVLMCNNDADHSFTLEGELRDRDYEVVIINKPTELLSSAKSLRPVTVLANPEIGGFNEETVCNALINEMNIPVILLFNKAATHCGNIGDCGAEDVVTKPVETDILANLIAKQTAWHGSNP